MAPDIIWKGVGMRDLVLRWLISAAALLAVSYLVPGIEVKGFFSALLAAMVLGVLNAVVRPILILLTLPLTIVTLGLFLLVINGLMLLLASALLPGFTVHGFWAALVGAFVLSLIGWFMSAFISKQNPNGVREMRRDADGVYR
jgi:putative membrane protein